MSETIKDEETSSEQGNAGRRRLVRGAMALAPVVLTLRSGGALAAASCTGAAKYLQVTLGGSGQIPANLSVNTTDVCYTTVTKCNASTEKLSTEPGSFDRLGVVSKDANGNFSCTGGKNNEIVAILSSQSAASLV